MTIESLIEKLQTFDSRKDVVIRDADTDWLLNIANVQEFDKYITFNGRYSDEYDGEDQE